MTVSVGDRSDTDDDLAVCAARLHETVGVLDVVEVEDLGRLGLISAVRDSIDNVLKRNFGKRKFVIACYQGAREYAQMPRAGNLKHRFQIGNGSAATQKTRQAGSAATSKHRERLQDRSVADEIEHGVDALRIKLAYLVTHSSGFEQHTSCTEPLERGSALELASSGDDL